MMKKTAADGSTKEIRRKIKGGNVREVLRSMKQSVPISKLMAVDGDIREYLLYCAISLAQMLGKRITLPDNLRKKTVTAREWSALGARLAGKKYTRFTISPDDVPTFLGGRRTAVDEGEGTR